GVLDRLRARRAGDGKVEYRDRILELLRPRERERALVGAETFGPGIDAVLSGYPGLCPAESVPFKGIVLRARFKGIMPRERKSTATRRCFFYAVVFPWSNGQCWLPRPLDW